ncbi:MAG: hypothetical protein DSY46_02865 [Hydrogenimonas sp.]|nr:MAG: hypothetical protein DSY46_02865 [Hydrogenimonas sp.]
MKRLKQELLIFFTLLILLALGMHFKAWINHPIAHIEALPHSTLGVWHPLYITAGVYILLTAIRILVNLIKKIVKKSQ